MQCYQFGITVILTLNLKMNTASHVGQNNTDKYEKKQKRKRKNKPRDSWAFMVT